MVDLCCPSTVPQLLGSQSWASMFHSRSYLLISIPSLAYVAHLLCPQLTVNQAETSCWFMIHPTYCQPTVDLHGSFIVHPTHFEPIMGLYSSFKKCPRNLMPFFGLRCIFIVQPTDHQPLGDLHADLLFYQLTVSQYGTCRAYSVFTQLIFSQCPSNVGCSLGKISSSSLHKTYILVRYKYNWQVSYLRPCKVPKALFAG